MILVALVACGGHQQSPPKAKPPDPKAVAAQLDADLAALAEVATRTHGDCGALIDQLRPLVARMQVHFVDVQTLQADPKLGRELKTEVQHFDARAAGRSDQIGSHLAATYLSCPACPKDCPPSEQQKSLRALIDAIPSV